MSYKDAEELVKRLGYTVHMVNGNETWLQALRTIEHTGQTIALQVWIESEQFEVSRMEGAIQITTGKCGSFGNLSHFASWEKQFVRLVERLK